MFSLDEIKAIRKYDKSEKVLKALKAKLMLSKQAENLTRQELINEIILTQNVITIILMEHLDAIKNLSILQRDID